MARFRGPILALILGVGILGAGDKVIMKVLAIVACVPPNAAPVSNAWSPGVTVNVNISGFPSNLQTCVQTAFNNWNTANQSPSSSGGNGSRVTFHSTLNGTPPALGPTGGTNVMQVTREQTTNSNGTTVNALGHTFDTPSASGASLKNANMQINPSVTDCGAITETTAHEIGHTMGLGECTNCTMPQQSVMGPPKCLVFTGGVCFTLDFNDTTWGLVAPTTCDNTVANTYYHCTQVLTCKGGYVWNYSTCTCVSATPVILDLAGKGFYLTSATGGVAFDISGDGIKVQMGWIAKGADNGFLALPGADGLVHSGKELFGNFTPQPASDHPNGFAALAVYDQASNGGNGDGVIDSKDVIFSSLRIWVDANHDGICQPSELSTLPSVGIVSISLAYKESDRTDQYGNKFRYLTAVNQDDPGGSGINRKAYDVFFVTSSGGASNLLPDLDRSTAAKCFVPKSGDSLASLGNNLTR